MKFDKTIWLDWNKKKPCPTCESGLLFPLTNGMIIENETKDSKFRNSYGYNYTEYIFSMHLKCSNCDEIVAVSGDLSEENEPSNEEFGIQRYYDPKSFYPPPKIISIPISCPKSVSKLLKDSFGLYWLDIGSCANKIRISIEVLMDELKINKTRIVRGKRKRLRLHERIEIFKIANLEVGNFLLSIKWIGNAGSHFSDIFKEDLLDAYRLLEYSLNQLYNDEKRNLIKISKEINLKKKPIKKKS
jgi:hypothetical protein